MIMHCFLNGPHQKALVTTKEQKTWYITYEIRHDILYNSSCFMIWYQILNIMILNPSYCHRHTLTFIEHLYHQPVALILTMTVKSSTWREPDLMWDPPIEPGSLLWPDCLLPPGPLGADPDWGVEYPDSFCVVEGSTATIPCSFTLPAGLGVKRVVWCPNHPICQGTTPKVYDSSEVRADSRFLYLGDLVRNCTLKIIKTEKRDAATYRFRIETYDDGFNKGYAGTKGVRVNVTGKCYY